MRWDLTRVAAASGGRSTGEGLVTDVVIDSRQAGPGSLFVALRGEHTDGHEFAAAAAAAGAVVLVERGRLPPRVSGVEVDDTLAALRALAAVRRDEIEVPVIAITGSNGKTTTKDLIAGALGERAHAAPKSFNNEIGVPLTVLGMPDGATSLILEVGSRGRGHITLLAPSASPDVAVITNIARAHLEMFGDLQGVMDAKWELVEALGSDGIAVLPAAEPLLLARRAGRMVTFGEEAGAHVAVSDVVMGDTGYASFTLAHEGRARRITMSMAGRHQPHNAAAAIAAAVSIGTPFEIAVERVAGVTGSEWRMEIHRGAITIVNDAYNANPDSTVAALETVAEMPGRHIAVLGKMHELGRWEAAGHREVGRTATDLGFAAVVVVGTDPGIAEGAGPLAHSAGNVAEAMEVLDTLLREGDVVLVKASRAVGLEVVAERLIGGEA